MLKVYGRHVGGGGGGEGERKKRKRNKKKREIKQKITKGGV